MAKRSIKSLHSTGRVSRKKASAIAKQLRAELDSGAIKIITGKKITRKTTASGRGAIAFRFASTKPRKVAKSRTGRKAARKAAR